MARKTVLKDIRDIRAGDVVRHAGKDRTVGNSDLKRSDFMGVTLFGDSYTLGYKKVEVVIMDRALPGVNHG